MKTWGFAVQSNDEGLFSAVTAVLELYLKTISHHIAFREVGKHLCGCILQDDHLELIKRGLSAQKAKEHLISPCLRLLTEVLSFDGGTFARQVYQGRVTTLKRLETFLDMRHVTAEDDRASSGKPSVRNNALQYLFTHLQFQETEIKVDILSHGKVLRGVFQNLRKDPPAIIHQILTVFRDNVLDDLKLAQRLKRRFFADWVLRDIASLYSYRHDDEWSQDGAHDNEQSDIPKTAHAFLLAACTTPTYGIVCGQVTSQANLDEVESDNFDIATNMEHYSYTRLQQPRRHFPTRNKILASFLQTLKPYASVMQATLAISIFQAAPELVAGYFVRKRSFSFEPKLTGTWIGYSTFLLSIIKLPLHARVLGPDIYDYVPPPVFDLIESILPQPMTQSIAIRCLNQNTNLVRLVALRIFVAAFEKLKQVLEQFKIASQIKDLRRSAWERAASGLVEEFCQRCPSVKLVIKILHNCPPEMLILRETAARLLSLYYRLLPQIALEEQLDVSGDLSSLLNESTAFSLSAESGLDSVLFSHLVEIAYILPGTHWWQKSSNYPSYDSSRFQG